MENDEREIRNLLDRWREASMAGDLDTVLSLMDDDVVFLTPGNPPMRKSGFAETFRGFSGRVQMDARQTVHEIRTSGDLAYCWSEITVSMTPADGGETKRRSGPVLSVFRRSPSGKWLLFRDANLLVGERH